MDSLRFCLAVLLIAALIHARATFAAAQGPAADPDGDRKTLFEQASVLTGIPWHYLAAVDRYEATMQSRWRRTDQTAAKRLLSMGYGEREWAGTLNPDAEDTNPLSIAWFGGAGQDGDGDGKADRMNDLDVLFTRTQHILKYGTTPDDFAIGLWEYYHNPRSVERILQFAKIYEHFDSLALHRHVFPLPLRAEYTYKSTWGARRSYGGARIHEGTDIFAGYGVPVRSASYGIVEEIGWNRFGGWRVGIRSLDNTYAYYAHLSGYNKPLRVGDVVEPGRVIGWVGSSGYGRPGTQGKFPPHLHFGLYRDAGSYDWSFDPYPLLRKWEREERLRRKGRISSGG